MLLEHEEIKILENYIDTHDRNGLEKIFKKHKIKTSNTLYRGSKVLKEELEVGKMFPHWHSYNSWSEDLNVATGFAKCDYIPEGIIGSVSKRILQDKNIVIYLDEIPSYYTHCKDEIIDYKYYNNEVYGDIFDKKVAKKELSYDELSKYILNAFFIIESGAIGININELYPSNEFQKEKEILLDTSNVKIVSIEQSKDYYIVKVA